MKKLLFAAWLYLAAAIPAFANVPCSLPFNLQNGTTADASQVMANYNALVTCLGSAAGAGVNNDITQLIGLTTPISPTQGGTAVFLGGTSTGSANAQVIGSTTPSGFTLNLNYQVIFKAGFSNSGATTLAVGASGAVNVFKQTPTGPVALTGNEIQAGQIVFAFYDGTQWEMLPPLSITGGFGISVSGSSQASISTSAPPYSYDAPINMGLSASVNANVLTVCMTTASGATPSASSPVLVPFRSTTLATGAVTWIAVTAQTCIGTNAAGATLGTQNTVPFRFWIEAFNNGGTVVLALWHSGAGAATTAINPLNEATLQSTTGISAAATSAGVFYTPNGTTVSNGAWRIAGYLEYSAGLATAGSYASTPTTLQVFGPGIPRPGSVIQMQFTAGTGSPSVAIAPTSAINLVRVSTAGEGQGASSANSFTAKLNRGGVQIGNSEITTATGVSTVLAATYAFTGFLDNPATTASTTYSLTITSSSGSVINGHMLVEEIQG